MTRQYLLGEMSALLAELSLPTDPQLTSAVLELRHQVESGRCTCVALLVEKAMALADSVCWSAIEAGDPGAFEREAAAARRLSEFVSATGIAAWWPP